MKSIVDYSISCVSQGSRNGPVRKEHMLQSRNSKQVEAVFNILVDFAEDGKHAKMLQEVIAFLENYGPFDYPPAHPCPARIIDLHTILKEIMR